MHIHLVNPLFPESFWSFRGCARVSRMRYGQPVVSLPTIAALTPPDVRVTLCDENVEDVDLDVACDVVGITAMNVQAARAIELARAFRKRGRTVVVGGPYVTLFADAMRPVADALFIGEAERTWPQFVDDWRAGKAQAVYEEHDKVDLRQSPTPRFELLKLDRYGSATMQISRGCPFDCEFCDIVLPAMSGRRVRSKSPAQVVREVETLSRLGAQTIFITDDNMTGHRKHAKRILRALAAFQRDNDYPLYFSCELSLDVASDDELLRLLRDANFSKVYVGVESPRAASLLETGKKQNLRTEPLAAVRKLQSYGLVVWAGMIVGFDNDDVDVFQEQFDFLQQAGIPVATVGPLIALPGTRLRERLAAEGRLRRAVHESGVDPIHVTQQTNVVPAQMSPQELQRGINWLVRALYRHDCYAERVLTAIDQGAGEALGRNRKVPPKQEWVDLVRLLRVSLFGGDARRVSLLARTAAYALLTKPNAIQTAITHAAFHVHYHQYVRQAFGEPAGVGRICPLTNGSPAKGPRVTTRPARAKQRAA